MNDPILITKNDYTIGVRNGDLGIISQVNEDPEAGGFGTLTIGDRDIEIEEDLLYKMDHGFAVTIHKSQGSQWQNVILVLDRAAENMLDKTLLYTGATRAQQQLIICCEDENLIDDAVARGSIASQRHTNLLTTSTLTIDNNEAPKSGAFLCSDKENLSEISRARVSISVSNTGVLCSVLHPCLDMRH